MQPYLSTIGELKRFAIALFKKRTANNIYIIFYIASSVAPSLKGYIYFIIYIILYDGKRREYYIIIMRLHIL